MTFKTENGGEASSKRPRAALIASLALNLLFVGGVGAAMWHHRHGPGAPWGHSREPGLLGFVTSLPAERQALVREQIETARTSLRPLRKEIHDRWYESNSALAAEPFDKQALRAALMRQTEAEMKFKSAIADALAEAAEKLNSEERRKLQAWRESRGRGRMGGFGRKPHMEDGRQENPGEPD